MREAMNANPLRPAGQATCRCLTGGPLIFRNQPFHFRVRACQMWKMMMTDQAVNGNLNHIYPGMTLRLIKIRKALTGFSVR